MRRVPYDLVADWQPEPESLLPSLGSALASLGVLLTFCGLIASVAILFA